MYVGGSFGMEGGMKLILRIIYVFFEIFIILVIFFGLNIFV